MLIFDIGCNKGEFIKACLEEFDKPKIIAVDANVDMLVHCKNKFPMNSNIEYQYCVMSDKIGIEDFFVSPEDGISTASRNWIENSRFAKGNAAGLVTPSQWSPLPRKIRSATLDKLIELYGEPDLIKIDVEGYEHKVVAGLSKKVGEVQFEWAEEEKENILKTVERLHDIGYEEFGIRGYFDRDSTSNLQFQATFDPGGDSHLNQPKLYQSYEVAVVVLDGICNPERRINWGMIHAK